MPCTLLIDEAEGAARYSAAASSKPTRPGTEARIHREGDDMLLFQPDDLDREHALFSEDLCDVGAKILAALNIIGVLAKCFPECFSQCFL